MTELDPNVYKPNFRWAGNTFNRHTSPTKCLETIWERGLAASSDQCTKPRLPGLEICKFHASVIDRRIKADDKRAQEYAEEKAQQATDKAKADELNRRIEGFTGEPAHLWVDNGMVRGFDVESLEAILRKAEDAWIRRSFADHSGLPHA